MNLSTITLFKFVIFKFDTVKLECNVTVSFVYSTKLFIVSSRIVSLFLNVQSAMCLQNI